MYIITYSLYTPLIYTSLTPLIPIAPITRFDFCYLDHRHLIATARGPLCDGINYKIDGYDSSVSAHYDVAMATPGPGQSTRIQEDYALGKRIQKKSFLSLVHAVG
jgi:hypothetical protein